VIPIFQNPHRRSTEWHLTQVRFDLLLSRLSPHPAEAGAQYEMLRGRLILFFSRRMLSYPEDLADEALNRLTRRLEEGEVIAKIEGYALGIARHVMQEQFVRIDTERAAVEEFSRNVSQQTHTIDEDEEIELQRMKKCLGRLPRSDQQLLSDYYLVGESGKIPARKRLAEARDVTPAALRKRVFELRGAIQKCIRNQRTSL
jgi:DNA-directed RNA polymerase specialized sigma24 family protein